MRFGTVCSGIEACSAAWIPMGWKPQFYSEIEPFASAVLRERHPDVPNLGDFANADFTRFSGAVDVVCAGTPCRDFSVAGRRTGLDSECGQLALQFFRLARDLDARWLVWENVRGVFSVNGGRDFWEIVRQATEFGYGVAWRVLDSSCFGVPQRRRRIFLVGHSGDWRPPVAVLFESGILRGDIESGEKEKVQAAGKSRSYADARSYEGDAPIAFCSAGHAASFTCSSGAKFNDLAPIKLEGNRVRKLTPLEWERCFGFPDGYTDIPHATRTGRALDLHRYRALGNSMVVPVIAWLGRRIELVDSVLGDSKEQP